MTTAQTMLSPPFSGARSLGIRLLAVLFAVLACFVPGCAGKRPVEKPTVLTSPYSAPRVVVWAVAPLRNESGVSLIDELALSDTLVNEAQQVEGISILPVNRTLAGMRALKMASVSSQADALSLCKALGADAIIVGSVNAWHPYDPPIIGLSLGLFGTSGVMNVPAASRIDAQSLRSAATDRPIPESELPPQPLSALSAVLDASDGNTRELIRRYAKGRHDPESALGWQRYTASMALYAKFACHEMTRRLLEAEQSRLRGSPARTEAAPSR